jgi:RNA polymerase sigma-70 factor (ECF subfamily)
MMRGEPQVRRLDADMDAQDREQIEATIRRLAEAGDFAGACEAGIRAYGREIFEFVAALHRSDTDAAEVFSMFAEGLWRGLPRFGFQSSFRTWAYVVARNASVSFRRKERRRAARNAPLPDGSLLSAIEEQVRTGTASFLRTERRDRLAALRAALPPEDQELLMLRVDRQLSWNDLAQVLRGEDAPPLEGEALKREAARLRKRYQLLKDKLYEQGRREGLLGGGDGD